MKYINQQQNSLVEYFEISMLKSGFVFVTRNHNKGLFITTRTKFMSSELKEILTDFFDRFHEVTEIVKYY